MSTPDLLAIIVQIAPVELPPPERTIPRWWGAALHRLALQLLNQADPSLAESAHSGSDRRPFTVSNLRGRYPEHALDLHERYAFRLTALNAATAASFLSAAESGGLALGATVELDHIPFRVESVTVDPQVHPLAGTDSYSAFAARYLLGMTPAPDRVTLELLSPTNFSSTNRFSPNGDHFPYPMPDLVFGGLLEHWNTCAGFVMPDELRAFAAKTMHIHHFDLVSRRVSVAGGMQVGSTGRVTFRVQRYDRYWMSLIDALAHFAFYGGVGAKTAMGLGQARVVEEDSLK